ncbi:MAG TPA: LysR family transcriptional regulator [Pseudonocardiaceae bacterium]|jgi:DNA-binding transcriptional LysR family regulator|nr:LysR family transcriptional regulator [Pseudonocardiaceae bacterium]
MLDVRKLRVLRSVVTSGSVSAAAANLGYTPSAVSQQVAALEREAGTALLEKAGRGVRPTAAGSLLAEHAAEIMGQLAAAENALADLRAGRTGRLRVHYFATAGAALVPPAVAEFRMRRPAVQLELRLQEPAYSADSALTGQADIQLVVLPPGSSPRSIPGTELVHLLDDPYRIVLPRGHRLADKDCLDLAELADDPWIDNEWPPGMCRKIMLDAFASAGFTPKFVVESDDYPTAQGFVAAGLGVTMVPDLGLGSVHAGVEVRRVRHPEPVRCIYAAIPAQSASTPLVRDMVTALVSAARRRLQP